MKVDELLDVVGDYLQEDFSSSPVWTKVNLLNCVRQVYRVFCELTGLVDRNEIVLINGTTGEAQLAKGFDKLYFAQFEQRRLDIAKLDELDFVSGTWLSGTTGTPDVVSVIGTGDGAVVQYVPVPASVWDGGSVYAYTGTTGMTLELSGAYYDVTCDAGQLVVSSGGSAPADSPIVAGPSVNWAISLTTGAVLVTSLSSGTVADWAVEDDSGSGLDWVVTCSDDGELMTTPSYGNNYGIATSAMLDTALFQDFSSDGSGASAEYGLIVDAYADATTTTPDEVVRVDSSRGMSLYAHTTDEAGMVWYKGQLPELDGLYSEVLLGDAFLPVLLHGVLSMAYSMNGDGKDEYKAKLLHQIFVSECEAIKRGFGFRWA